MGMEIENSSGGDGRLMCGMFQWWGEVDRQWRDRWLCMAGKVLSGVAD